MNEHIQSKRKLGPAALSLCIVAIASTAEAQGIADSFEQLRVLMKPGDTVSVTDTSGREVTGTITALSASSTALSASSLAMRVDGTQQELTEHEVATIRQRRGDSLANGSSWGLVSGAALSGTLLFFVESDGAGDAAGFVAAYGGLGAAAGVGVDALITGRRVIYERPATRAGKVSVSPVFDDFGSPQVGSSAGPDFSSVEHRFSIEADDLRKITGLGPLDGLRVAPQTSDVVQEPGRLPDPTGAEGKDVRVTLNDGTTRQGKLQSFSPSEVTLEGTPIPLADVRKIEKVGHATRKAVWIGLLAGVPTFLILGPAADMGKDMALMIVAAGVGGGIAVGAAIDAARKPGNVIYVAPGTSVSFTVRPILAPDRQGVAFVTNW